MTATLRVLSFPAWETLTIHSLSPQGVGYSSFRVQESPDWDSAIQACESTWPLRSYWRSTCELTLDGLHWTWDSQFPLDIPSTLCFPFPSPFWNCILIYTDGSQHFPYQLVSESWSLLKENTSVTEEYLNLGLWSYPSMDIPRNHNWQLITLFLQCWLTMMKLGNLYPPSDPPSPKSFSSPKVSQLPKGKPKTCHKKAPPKSTTIIPICRYPNTNHTRNHTWQPW